MATPFDFGGLLGGTFGGGLSGLEDLLTPEQLAAIQRQSGLSAAAALLQAAGPSTTRTSLGQALGSAFTAGQAGMQKGTESALTQMLTRQKLDEAKRARDLQANIAKILTGGAAPAGGDVTAEEALAVPGMAAGPTPERAALIGQPRPQAAGPQMSGSELKARQYRQMADVYAAGGKGEEAKRFMDIAESLAPSRQEVMGQPFEVIGAEGKPVMVQQFKDGTLKPVQGFSGRQKVTGQPFEVTSADGNSVLVQQYEDGSLRTMPGFGPKREVVLQNVGNRIVAVDKSKLKGGESLAVGMTPAEQQNLNIALQRLKLSKDEFDRGAYDRVESAQGIVYVPKMPGLPIIPITDAAGAPVIGAGGKPTEGESNAAGFSQRMERAQGILSSLPPEAVPGVASAMAGSIPLVGGLAQRKVQDPQEQQFKQAADDWIRAKLRKESGAAIGKDEMASEYVTYFPQVGDTPEVISQKAYARQVATNAMRQSAGKAYKPFVESPEETQARQPPAPPPREGATSKTKSGQPIVFRNGKWVYQ